MLDGKSTIGLITFYLGNYDDKRFVHTSWEILEDDEKGNTCFIDNMITTSNPENKKFSWRVLRMFTQFIGNNYPNVKAIRWNHVKEGKDHVYRYRLAKQED